MSNEELSNIPPLVAVVCVVLAFLGIMAYQFRQQVKAVAVAFKGGVVAVLIALGVLDSE